MAGGGGGVKPGDFAGTGFTVSKPSSWRTPPTSIKPRPAQGGGGLGIFGFETPRRSAVRPRGSGVRRHLVDRRNPLRRRTPARRHRPRPSPSKPPSSSSTNPPPPSTSTTSLNSPNNSAPSARSERLIVTHDLNLALHCAHPRPRHGARPHRAADGSPRRRPHPAILEPVYHVRVHTNMAPPSGERRP